MPGGRRAGPGRPGPGSVSCPGCGIDSLVRRTRASTGKGPRQCPSARRGARPVLAAISGPAVHRGRLVERWGEAGGGVQVRGIGVSVDRKTVRGEPGGADDRDTGQRDQHLAGGVSSLRWGPRRLHAIQVDPFATVSAWVASLSWSHVPPFNGGTAVFVAATIFCPACWAVLGRTAGSASCRQPLA
jgi:hypothetical protein